MPNQTRFPSKDADFNNYVNIAIPYANANKTRLALTPASQSILTQLLALLSTAGTGWNIVYMQTQNPSIATSSLIATKNTVRTQIESSMRTFFGDIPRSVLTQIDRDTLNLPLPSDSHTPVSKPTAVPTLGIANRGHLFVTLNIIDSANSNSKSKPSGVDSIEIEGAFLLNTEKPTTDFPTEKDFRHLDLTNSRTYTRNYLAEQLKGIEYIRARYLNSRNQPGNWSEIITVIVS